MKCFLSVESCCKLYNTEWDLNFRLPVSYFLSSSQDTEQLQLTINQISSAVQGRRSLGCDFSEGCFCRVWFTAWAVKACCWGRKNQSPLLCFAAQMLVLLGHPSLSCFTVTCTSETAIPKVVVFLSFILSLLLVKLCMISPHKFCTLPASELFSLTFLSLNSVLSYSE